jgi:hypothetical protein
MREYLIAFAARIALTCLLPLLSGIQIVRRWLFTPPTDKSRNAHVG